MNFKYPFFLYFLLLAIIPIIIHLINLRKHKKVFFSNVKLLNTIKSRKSSYNKLKDIILMITRMLAVSFLVIAFAQPFLPEENIITTKNQMVLYIDNSPSMNNTINETSLLEIAKKQALKLVEEVTTNVFLITNDDNFTQKIPKTEIENKISEINTSYTIYNFNSIISKIKNNPEITNPIVYAISDFQTNAFKTEDITNDSSLNIQYLQILGDQDHNISIDSCWTNPQININENNILYVKLSNHGSQNKTEIPINLFLNNNLVSISNTNIEAKKSNTVAINFSTSKTGWNYGYIKINDHPITYDDKLFFSFKIEKEKKILNIYEETDNQYLSKIFNSDSVIEYHSQNVNTLNYNAFQKYNVIILDEIQKINKSLIENIVKYILKNKTIVILPHKDADINSYNELLKKINGELITNINYNQQEINQLNLSSNIYKNVFLNENKDMVIYPYVNQYYQTQKNHNAVKEDIITLENEETLMSKYFYKNGEIYFFKAGLSDAFGNFNQNALIVPTFYNIVLYSFKNHILYYDLKNNLTIKINDTDNKNETFEIQHCQNKNAFIPRVTNKMNVTEFETLDQIKKNGHYFIKQNNDTIMFFSINYQSSEGNQTYLDAENFNNKKINFLTIKDKISEKKVDLNKKTPLWKYCLIIVLLCLLLEFFLIRLL